MRAGAGWGVVVALVATSMGVGCEPAVESAPLQVEESVLPPEDSSETEVPADSPSEDKPSEDKPSPVETGPILVEVPACIPVTVGKSSRFPYPCTAKRFWTFGVSEHHQRFDTEGRPLESTELSSDGSKHTSKWSYDEAGRLLLAERLRYARDGHSLVEGHEQQHVYDAQGRLERIEHYQRWREEAPRWRVRHLYRYGEGGRLEAIELWDYEGLNGSITETFAYHANGQLRRYLYESDWNTSIMLRKDYDEQGRLIFVDRTLSEGVVRTTYTYDARGRLATMRDVQTSGGGTTERLTRYQYDDSGRIVAELFTENGDFQNAPVPHTVRRRELKRYIYSCEGDLLVEELDSNEDGVRDGWRELVRDAAGNLLEERFQGMHVQPWYSLLRIEYDYACHEQASEP